MTSADPHSRAHMLGTHCIKKLLLLQDQEPLLHPDFSLRLSFSKSRIEAKHVDAKYGTLFAICWMRAGSCKTSEPHLEQRLSAVTATSILLIVEIMTMKCRSHSLAQVLVMTVAELLSHMLMIMG